MLYLRCEECGGVFDEIEIAYTHGGCTDNEPDFKILTEEEAF